MWTLCGSCCGSSHHYDGFRAGWNEFTYGLVYQYAKPNRSTLSFRKPAAAASPDPALFAVSWNTKGLHIFETYLEMPKEVGTVYWDCLHVWEWMLTTQIIVTGNIQTCDMMVIWCWQYADLNTLKFSSYNSIPSEYLSMLHFFISWDQAWRSHDLAWD